MSYTVLQARAVSTHTPIIYSLQEKKRKERMDSSAQEKKYIFRSVARLVSLNVLLFFTKDQH